MLGHNFPAYFCTPSLFVKSLVISLTLIHSNIAKIGLSLDFNIIELKDSLKLFTKQSVKALEVKCDLVHYAGAMFARYSYALLSKSFMYYMHLSNSLTVVAAAHLHSKALKPGPDRMV